jgi:putative peptidoglycan lipid II flippase
MSGLTSVGHPSSMWTVTRASAVVGVQMLAGAAGAFVLHAMAAAMFGAGARLDAYYVGAAFPIVVVSAFTAGLVFIVAPLVRDGGSHADADHRAMPAGSLAVVVGLSLIFAGGCSMLSGPIIQQLGGHLDTAVQPAAERVLRIQAWAPLFVAVATWLSAHLVANGRPALASGGPVVGNGIAILVFAVSSGRGDIVWLAWAVLIGAVVQLLFATGAVRLGRVFVMMRPPTVSAARRTAWLVLPWLGAAVLYKSHTLVDRVVGSWDVPGSVTALALGLTVVTVAASALTRGIGLTLSPRLGGDLSAVRHEVWSGVRAGFLLLAPAFCILVVLRGEVVALLFGRGQFTATDVAATAATLVPYSVVLVALGMGNIITTTFYSLGDTRTPAVVGIAGLFLHLAVTLALWPVLGYLSAAWGFAAMSSGVLATLTVILMGRIGRLADRTEAIRALQPVGLAVLCAPILPIATMVLASRLDGGEALLALRVALAGAVYLAAYGGAVVATTRREAPSAAVVDSC